MLAMCVKKSVEVNMLSVNEGGLYELKAERPKQKAFLVLIVAFSFTLLAFCSSFRFLLAQAMKTAQTPDNIRRINADNLPAGKAGL